MAKTDFKSVAAYIAVQPKATASVLSRMRTILKRALPHADEVISYQIPTYRLHGRNTLFFAGYKEHVALYPASAAVLRALGDAAKGHLASKATLRFSLDEPLPAKLIERAAKARSQEVAEIVAAKKPAAKKPVAKKAGARKPAASHPTAEGTAATQRKTKASVRAQSSTRRPAEAAAKRH